MMEGTEITKDNDDDDLEALLKAEVDFFIEIKKTVSSSITTVEKTITSISGKDVSKTKTEINKIVDGKLVDSEGAEIKVQSASIIQGSLIVFVQMQYMKKN